MEKLRATLSDKNSILSRNGYQTCKIGPRVVELDFYMDYFVVKFSHNFGTFLVSGKNFLKS